MVTKPSLRIISTVFVAIVVGSVVLAETRRHQSGQPFRLLITPVAGSPDTVDVAMTNTSGQSITAWCVQSYVAGERVMSSGEDLMNVTSFPTGQTRHTQLPGSTSGDLRASVIFADQKATGDEGGIEELFAQRMKNRDDLAVWVAKLQRASQGEAKVLSQLDSEAVSALNDDATSGPTKSLAIDIHRVLSSSDSSQQSLGVRTLLDSTQTLLDATRTAARRMR